MGDLGDQVRVLSSFQPSTPEAMRMDGWIYLERGSTSLR